MSDEVVRAFSVLMSQREDYLVLATRHHRSKVPELSDDEFAHAVDLALNAVASRWQEWVGGDPQEESAEAKLVATRRFLENVWDPEIRSALQAARAKHRAMN